MSLLLAARRSRRTPCGRAMSRRSRRATAHARYRAESRRGMTPAVSCMRCLRASSRGAAQAFYDFGLSFRLALCERSVSLCALVDALGSPLACQYFSWTRVRFRSLRQACRSLGHHDAGGDCARGGWRGVVAGREQLRVLVTEGYVAAKTLPYAGQLRLLVRGLKRLYDVDM